MRLSVLLYPVLLSALAFRGEAEARDRRTVIVRYTAACGLLSDVEGELRAAGFDLLVQREMGDDSSMPTAASAFGAVAAVRLSPDCGTVTVYVGSSEAAAAVLSTQAVGDDARADSVTAFKTAELLRVELMPAALQSDAAADDEPVAAVPGEKTTQRALYRLSAAAAPAVTYGFGNIPAALHVFLMLSARAGQHIRLSVSGLVPTFGGTVESEIGNASIKEGLIAVGLDAVLDFAEKKGMVLLGFMGGAYCISADGRSRLSSAQGHAVRLWVGTVGMHGGGLVQLSDRVALRGDLWIGVTFPEPVIRIGAEEVAAFGRPVLTGALGVEVGLF